VIPCAQIAVGDKKDAYDVGDMNGNFFSYVAAFGAFTSVSYETPQATKNLFGRTAYILDGAVKLGKTKSYHIKVQTDLETWEQDCILGMVTNAKSVAGLKLYKKNSVSLKDGLLDGIFVKTPKNPIELNQVMAFLLHGKANSHVKVIHSSHVEISCKEALAYTLDGENGGKHKKAVIQNHPQAITYFCG
jgi:diacylglycerol kinase (ATP)